MKRYLLLALVVFSWLLLAGCATHRYPYLNKHLAHESWMQFVDANPNMWTRGADNWFMTGDPNATEMADRNAPYSAAISTMMVKVPEFLNIKSNGDFQVQLFGTYGPSSVYVFGPNDAVRSVVVRVHGNTLCIDQVKNAPRSVRRVIIRVGVNQLGKLVQLGCGPIEAIQMHSMNLSIMSLGKGNIYLAGPVNLSRVTATNAGSVSVFGAVTPNLDIRTSGSGSVNVSGRVGVHTIVHHGVGNINIIGADSDSLRIYTDGRGKIGIRGPVNLREIKARGKTCVFLCNALINGGAYVWAYDYAKVGMAGSADNLYVETYKGARFEGRSMCVMNAFVRAHDWSHINITATNKIFAAATENGSVYFFGQPNIMSQYVGGYGVVLPVWSGYGPVCPVAEIRPSYKGEVNYKGELDYRTAPAFTPVPVRRVPIEPNYNASVRKPAVNKPAAGLTPNQGEPKPSGFPHSKFKWVNKKLQGEG